MTNFNKKCAFTLAEVLITLAIIGVIVAMTIPSLMYRHKQITTVNKVKNFYSKMNNLMVHVIQNNAELKYLNWTDYAENPEQSMMEFWSYFKPYLSVAKDCGTSENSDCVPNKIMTLNSVSSISENNTFHYKVILKDGGSFWFSNYPGHCTYVHPNVSNGPFCGYIHYDVNGLKAPNIVGKDVFFFFIKSNEIIPTVINDCSKNRQGLGCSDYILLHENMDYLK